MMPKMKWTPEERLSIINILMSRECKGETENMSSELLELNKVNFIDALDIYEDQDKV